MFVVALLVVPVGVTMVVGVKPPMWAEVVVDMLVEVSLIVDLVDTSIAVIAGMITVLAALVTEALTGVVIGALAGLIGVGMLVDVDIIEVAVVSIVLKFMVDVFIEALSGVRDDVIIGVFVPFVCSDVLVGVNANVFAAVMTALKFITPAPVEGAFGC